MKKYKLDDFHNGWVIGNFVPAIVNTRNFEVCVKRFQQGETEAAHHQLIARELTIVVSGHCRLANISLTEGDCLLIEPGEVAAFEAVEDSVVVGVKWPSLANDKIVD